MCIKCYPSSGKSFPVMEDVCKKTGVRDQQLDQEIPENDIILIAKKFPHLLSVHKVGSTLNLNILIILAFVRGEQSLMLFV